MDSGARVGLNTFIISLYSLAGMYIGVFMFQFHCVLFFSLISVFFCSK